MNHTSPGLELAEAVRQACVQAAVDAYEDAALRGLCEDGRCEVAIDAIRRLDLSLVIGGSSTSTSSTGSG